MRFAQLLRCAAATAAIVALGCKLPVGGEGGDPTNGTGPTDKWSFTMALAHNNFTIAQNATDTNIVTFTRVGGFTGPINLSYIIQDSSLTITSEPITSTGVVTTTRLLTKVPGAHNPFPSELYGVSAQPASDHVEPQFVQVQFAIVRKDGTFINAPAALSIGRGQSAQQRISIIRTNYTAPDPFNLVLFNGAPTGITATFSPNPIPGTDTVTQMTLTVDPSVPEGVYSLGVRNNEGTSFQGTAPLTLTVTAAGSITLSAGLSTLAVPKNTTVPAGFTIARTNYSGPVTITVTGVPAGVTVTPPPPVVTNNFSIGFTNTATGTPGSYPVVITATGPGLTPVSITLTLSIS